MSFRYIWPLFCEIRGTFRKGKMYRTKIDVSCDTPRSFMGQFVHFFKSPCSNKTQTPQYVSVLTITANLWKPKPMKQVYTLFTDNCIWTLLVSLFKINSHFNPERLKKKKTRFQATAYRWCAFCFSYDLDDAEFVKIYRSLEDLIRTVGNGLGADYFPLLRYIPTPALTKVKQCVKGLRDFLEKHLDEHRKSYNHGKHAQQINMLGCHFSSVALVVSMWLRAWQYELGFTEDFSIDRKRSERVKCPPPPPHTHTDRHTWSCRCRMSHTPVVVCILVTSFDGNQ